MLRTLKTAIAACFVLLSISAVGGESTAADHARALLDEIVPTFACNFKCRGSPPCGLSMDHMVWSQSDGGSLGASHGCMTQSSCSYHNCSPPDEEDLQQLVELLPKVAPAEILELTEDRSELVINSERGAVQLLGCEGLVVVSVPFSDEQAVWFAGTR